MEIPARFARTTSVVDSPWMTPSILNSVTRAQPMVDKFNRTLFDQLGLHDTFVTRCFETRFSLHFLIPCTYVNAVNASKYFMEQRYKGMLPKKMLLELSYMMVTNDDWAAERVPYGVPGTSASGTRSGSNYTKPMSSGPTVSINGGPPSRESPCKHVLVPLSQILGYKGAKQQRCWECNELVSWACARCSDSRNICALHPPITQGARRKYGCLAAHRRDPTGGGYKQFHEGVTGTSKSSKRRRKLNMHVIADSD